MDVVVRGRNVDLSQRFREHVDEKLARIDRFGVTLSLIDVEVSRETNPRLSDRAFEVELTCRGKGPVIRAEAAAQDQYAALDAAYGRLEERLRRAADKRRAGRRANGSLAAATEGFAAAAAAPVSAAEEVKEPEQVEESEEALPPGIVYAEGPVVVREKSHAAAPMTVEQALHEMELVGHDFFLFSDTDSGMPSVVYRRRGYDYGLIRLQPEGAAADA